MSSLQATCPSCAGPIEFTAGSTIVIICPFCKSAVARTDRGLEDLGKIAEISQSESPLRVGLHGEFRGNRFQLTGRAQLRHQMGGTWDEWYATFSNGWVGWLAEAQGRFYLTFYQPLPDGTQLPGYDAITPGTTVPQIPAASPLMVQEKGVATYAAAEGEIPYKLVPGEQSPFADLAGRDNAFATIDYSFEPPWVFIGQQVTLDDIGLAHAKPAEREAPRVSAAAMGCPNCGGPLELVAPDKAERVACPYCNSLLDVNRGNLTYLHALNPSPSPHEFVLPLGAEGALRDGPKFKIIGAVVRSVTIEGETYYWNEYLLYNPSVGFRWLVHSDNHWNFVEPVNPADVTTTEYIGPGATAEYNGRKFKIFQDAQARVEFVKGEFYWRVEQGETVRAADYISAPMMLSLEQSENEINWSVGTYLTNDEVEKAFGVSGLPKPWGVAPNQPFTGQFYYTWGVLPLVGLLLVAAVMFVVAGIPNTVLSQEITLQPLANPQATQTAFSQQFELKANRNVEITARAPVSNSFADLDVDLVNDQSQEVESVNVPIEFYSGVEDGESWSEGGQQQSATLSSLPGGKYTLRVEGNWQDWQQPMPITVKVEQSVSRGVNFCCAFVALLLVPIFGIIRKWSFESSRWKDSMFTTSGSSDDSDDSGSDE